MSESLLWVEKYRPKTIEDCILPESIKKTLRDVVSQNKIPNLMFFKQGFKIESMLGTKEMNEIPNRIKLYLS